MGARPHLGLLVDPKLWAAVLTVECYGVPQFPTGTMILPGIPIRVGIFYNFISSLSLTGSLLRLY